ncbi:Jiraiya domain containing protein [Asbolus verrucosus]|uniref:Jiraiya domain containing protein n=1 Tax=Asbolus verrucosus TaxID=1661398 RepID=A0A482V8B1_ASBVE|nr:Jiraiya domain containing protein [Asbolus verrucosus]
MLKHMLNTNGAVANRVSRPDSSMVMEPRIDQTAHRYRSPNANSSRISQQYPLNVSQLHPQNNLDNSKHSIYSNAVLSPGNKTLNGGLNISRVRNQSTVNKFIAKSKQVGVKEMLVSLGLLCLVSLLLALLSLIFLLKISPVTANDIRELLRAEQLTVITAEEYVVVYEVTLALLCAIQFLFAVKLVKSPHGGNDR